MPSALWVVVRGVSLGEVPEQKNEKTAECREHSPCRVGEVGLGAQRRQREEAGARADRRQRRGLQPHRQGGQGQGQSLQLRELVGLELLLQYTNRGALAPLSPPVPPPSPHKTPDVLG